MRPQAPCRSSPRKPTEGESIPGRDGHCHAPTRSRRGARARIEPPADRADGVQTRSVCVCTCVSLLRRWAQRGQIRLPGPLDRNGRSQARHVRVPADEDSRGVGLEMLGLRLAKVVPPFPTHSDRMQTCRYGSSRTLPCFRSAPARSNLEVPEERMGPRSPTAPNCHDTTITDSPAASNEKRPVLRVPVSDDRRLLNLAVTRSWRWACVDAPPPRDRRSFEVETIATS